MGEGSDSDLTLDRTAEPQGRRPRALWGALAALAVLGGALAVAAGGGDDEGRSTLPVALGSVGGTGEGTMSADSSRAAWVTYVAGEGLPTLGGTAPAYRLSGSVDEARVAELASALGLDGTPERSGEGFWNVRDDDGALEVHEGAGGTWWYSSTASLGTDAGGGSAGCAGGPADDCIDPDAGSCTTTESPDGWTEEVCVERLTPQPEDLPSKEDAESAALALLEAAGVDVERADVTVDGPYDAWYVTVEPLLDGVPVSGAGSTVGIGSGGVVTSASGTLAVPERLDDYPLVDTSAAIDRLNQQSADIGVIEPLPADDVVVDDLHGDSPDTTIPCKVQPDGREICEVEGHGEPFDRGECVEIAEGSDAEQSVSSSCAGIACPQPLPGTAPDAGDEPATTVPHAGDQPAPTCAPPPILPDPEPIEVVLTGAAPVLLLMPSLDGSSDAYLVPGYRFTSDDGQIVEVPAVTDDSLTGTSTATDQTAVPVPVPPETGTAVPPDGEAFRVLEDGETPEIGVPYYVDVDVECAAFELGGEIWRHTVGDLAGWSLPHEGGRFTLDAPDHGTFVGDWAGEKTATFELTPGADGCTPTPRP